MAENIDSLQIEINAQAGKANDAIDRLINRIDKLTTSIGHLDGSNLASLANGVQRLGTAMQTMNNVKTADFSRLARNLQNLNNIDVSKLSNLSVNVKHIATAFNGLSGMDKSAEQISMLANGIKQLGYSSAEKAIKNIPLIATAMKKLMAELSTAPKVSRNIIDMTNALAKFARTGSSGGKAANTLVNSFNRVSKASIGMKFNMLGAVSGITSLSRSLLSAAGIAGGFYAIIRGIKESINISSDLTEVQNVVDVTFGNFKQKIEDLAKVSIPELGMSELTVKQIASRFQAMGVAMGISQKGMADMSTELTRLAGDMASFYNVEQKAVGEDLESIFTGQTKPLRQYGLDLTEATLQEWAMKQGIDANINSMSQMEKTMLRYQYVMANTGAAQGDFIRTADTWANQVRVLKENFKALASVVGTTFINALKPLVSALNNAMSHIIAFAKVVSNSLGKIFGWKFEDTSGGVANNYADAADSADDLAAGTGKAADNAKKLRQQLQKVDELNVLSSNKDNGSGGGSGSGGGETGGADASGGQWVKTDSILKDYESQLDTLYKLGEHIGNTLTNAMKNINWDGIYDGAKNFGSGLASFLNGLISPELFGEVGKTVASSLNTALYSLNSFGKTFDWKDFGNSIASGINNFFSTFDFENVADAINVWVDGIKTTLITAIKKIKWSDVIKGAFDFVGGLELDTIMIALGVVAWKYKGKELALSALSSILATEIATGIGSISLSLGATIGLSITTAIVGFKIGETAYDKIPTVQQCSDALVELVGGLFTGEYKLGDIIKGNLQFVTDMQVKLANLLLPDGRKIKESEAHNYDILGNIWNMLFGDSTEKDNSKIFFINIGLSLLESAQEFYEKKIKPIIEFVEKKGIDIAVNIIGSDKIDKLKELKKTWDDLKKKAKSKLSFKTSITDSVSSKLQKIKNLWEGFKTKTLKLSATFTDTFTAPLKAAWNKVANLINGAIEKMNKLPGVDIKVKLQTFATGGFPEDGWFRASHGEMIGKFDNGQSVVANNQQITDGISAAVYRGNQQMVSYMQQEITELRMQNQLLTELLNKEVGISYSDVGKASQKYAREYTNRTGKPAYI